MFEKQTFKMMVYLIYAVMLLVGNVSFASPKKVSVKDTPKVHADASAKKKKIYGSPFELIQGHNFWIGCMGDMRMQLGNNPFPTVKKLFLINNYEDELAIMSIPNGIDFVFFNESITLSEHVVRSWYEKIRPGGMLIGLSTDSSDAERLRTLFHEQNTSIQATSTFWYIQKKHFLSCIIPTYNRAHTLSQAIDSLYKQQLTIPFEVIVTDDASTDNTQALLKTYKQRYDNFHFYVHEANGGASKARNTCIAHAQGDLIFNLDSDNYLEPRTLQALVDLLDTTGCDAAIFEMIKYFYAIGSDRKLLSHVWQFKFPHNICSFPDIFGNARLPIASGNYLFTKKSFERVHGYKGRVMETWRFGYHQLATGTRIAILPHTYYWHRLSDDGKWKNNEALHKNNHGGFKAYQQYPELIMQDEVFLNTHETNFLTNIEKGILMPLQSDIVRHIFNAYRFEEFKLLDLAIQEYDAAIHKGARHAKIYARRAKACAIR
jgi:glycosyltransferase involved in cell wall biosynthesis